MLWKSPAKLGKDGTVQTLSANDQVTLGTMALNATKEEVREVKLESRTVPHQNHPEG